MEAEEEISVEISAVQAASNSRPCFMFVDVSLKEPLAAAPRCLTFRNYYVGELTVKARVSPYSKNALWETLLNRHRLMEDVHSEDDAQKHHTVELGQRQESGMDIGGVTKNRIYALRLYLIQPSPRWQSLSFCLEHIHFHRSNLAILGGFDASRRKQQAVSGSPQKSKSKSQSPRSHSQATDVMGCHLIVCE